MVGFTKNTARADRRISTENPQLFWGFGEIWFMGEFIQYV